MNEVASRRNFLAGSALAGLAALAPGPALAWGKPGKIGKQGLCIARKTPEWPEKLKALRCGWFYNWGPNRPAETPRDVAFRPMIWGYWGQDEKIAEAGKRAKAAGIKELLGFNEPDQPNQSNMSVEKALHAWPVLEETGLRLGSPGCVHPDREWMTTFMERAKKRGRRVDFVCVHSYGGTSVEALVKRLQEVHRMFGKPIWITEFAVGDWEAKSPEQNRHKPGAVLKFMEKALPALEKLDFVERYAWFPAGRDNRHLGTSALFDEAGALTRLGECYRDH